VAIWHPGAEAILKCTPIAHGRPVTGENSLFTHRDRCWCLVLSVMSSGNAVGGFMLRTLIKLCPVNVVAFPVTRVIKCMSGV